MAEKKRNWDEWIGGMTGALGASALGASAIRKVQTDARNEARAMSYPKREVTYSRAPAEKEARIKRIMESSTFGKIEPKPKSGSIGRGSAETARDNRRRLTKREKSRKK